MLEGIHPPSGRAGFQTRWSDFPTGAPPRRGFARLVRLLIKVVCLTYLRVFHDFRFRYSPATPRGRSYIALISHTSVLDVPCLLAADPFDPPTTMVIKSEMVRVPLLGKILQAWGAIPVDRRGQDISALRQIRKVLVAGQGVCIAPSGTRSHDGHLGPINPVLVRLILQSDAPVFPVAIVGTYECMSRRAAIPRPGKIYLETGSEIDLRRFRGRRLTPADLEDAARALRDGLAAHLPASMQPLPDTPVLGSYVLDEKDA
ncbi:MAG TPA: lysophospholipid acyltransferase family protein [Chloroflexota bacterium]|nr:lysophospholipid acyltransferase family protein [Chloroflexota bacterium]